MSDRIEFPSAVKKIVAERAGLRCSVPCCDKLTTGPGSKENDIARTGMACHIHSASKGGPRGRGGLSDAELKSEKNAIWCCYTHGKQIDTNKGERFPSEILKRWRKLHEIRIDRERLNLPTGLGWLDKLEIPNGWLFERGANFTFGQATLLRGKNGVGKTAIADWLAGLAGLPTLGRWQHGPPKRTANCARLTYYAPEEQLADVEISASSIVRRLNDKPMARPLPNLNVVYVGAGYRDALLEDEDVAKVAKAIGVEPHYVLPLAKEVTRFGSPFAEPVYFKREKKEEMLEWGLRVDVGNRSGVPIGTEASFNQLSGSEQLRLLIEFALARARLDARYAPTLLVLDSPSSLDSKTIDAYAEYLSSQPYQTLLLQSNQLCPETEPWAQWRCFDVVKCDDSPSRFKEFCPTNTVNTASAS